jgi:type IV pilus biogenesis protein CpaD/CtpE
MRTVMAGAALLAIVGCAAQPVVTSAAAPVETTLNGRWIVDLSVKPDEPYTKPMELALAVDGTVTGSFYESEILAGRWKTARGRTCVSFRTTDGAGPYHTAACLVGDGVVGQTWAEHRNFLFNWDAVRG